MANRDPQLILAMFLSAYMLGSSLFAQSYPYPPYLEGKMDPQGVGWPLTEAERTYVLKPEYERRPGRESNQHLPNLWPVIPSAGNWGGTHWLDTHAKLVEYVRANQGQVDLLLVGDSITQQWGSPLEKGVFNEAWTKHFREFKTLNIGIGGDKSQNVLWRLDHGAIDGIDARLVLLMIGNNNMFFTAETGIEAAAKGIEMCVSNLRSKLPKAHVLVVKILPCHKPGERFYEDIKLTNAALDKLHLDSDPKVHVLDLTNDFIHADGSIRPSLFTADGIHLSLDGYRLYAQRLQPMVDKWLDRKR